MADISELTDDQKHELSIMRNVYRKLDALPLGFGLPQYSDDITDEVVRKNFGIDLNDTLRELSITISQVESGTYEELMVENRALYYALKRFRLTASTFFKFSTATDGKTIDKTSIPKMLQQIIGEYDAEFKKWKGSSAGSIWKRNATLNYTNV